MPPKDPTIEEAKAFRGRARPVSRDASASVTLGNFQRGGPGYGQAVIAAELKQKLSVAP